VCKKFGFLTRVDAISKQSVAAEEDLVSSMASSRLDLSEIHCGPSTRTSDVSPFFLHRENSS